MKPLIVTGDARARTLIEAWLEHMGPDVCDVLAGTGVRITVLHDAQTFSEVSPVLRRLGAGVDGWPIPPAGLFVVEERSVILRSLSAMTFFHEVGGHAIDLCLGGSMYRSAVDPRFRKRFNQATSFATPYAASGCDEFWAESARCWWGPIANDPHSLWPAVSRERLRRIDAEMYELVRWAFEDEIPRMAAAIRARPHWNGDVAPITSRRCGMAKPEPTLEERARAEALREVAIELRAIDDTLDYLDGIRSHRRAILQRGALEERGLLSSETIVRGIKARALAVRDHRLHVPRPIGRRMRKCESRPSGGLRSPHQRRLFERDVQCGLSAVRRPAIRCRSDRRRKSGIGPLSKASLRLEAPMHRMRCPSAAEGYGMDGLSYRVILEPEPDGSAYNVIIPAFPHAHTFGESVPDAMRNAREIIELELEAARERGDEIPPSDAEHVVIGTVTVSAA